MILHLVLTGDFPYDNTIGGSISDNQLAFGSSTSNEIEGSDDLIWDGTSLEIEGSINVSEEIQSDFLSVLSNPTSDGDVGNRGYNDTRYLQDSPIDNNEYVRKNGAWFISSSNSSISGSISENQLAFGSSVLNEIEGSDDLTWNGSIFNIKSSSVNGVIEIESSGSGAEGLMMNFPNSSGRPITIYDNGVFVGGLDYNFFWKLFFF